MSTNKMTLASHEPSAKVENGQKKGRVKQMITVGMRMKKGVLHIVSSFKELCPTAVGELHHRGEGETG